MAISLYQCLRVLNSYPISIVAPEKIKSKGDEWFQNILEDMPHEWKATELSIGLSQGQITVDYLPSQYFLSVATYNRLMLSRAFYEHFKIYDYMLIYQLDAFVFSDQLLDWCRQGYDYIGAPWLGVDWTKEPILRVGEVYRWKRRLLRRFFADPLYYIGNGGFSLRKTSAMLRWLSLYHKKAQDWQFHEDSFWGIFIRANYPFVRFPTVAKALEFSFEVQPRQCYSQNNEHLPFGCHAWWTYDLDFWRPWIEGYGYTLGKNARLGEVVA
jgi:hypothetical protein